MLPNEAGFSMHQVHWTEVRAPIDRLWHNHASFFAIAMKGFAMILV